MSKLDDLISQYQKDLEAIGETVNADLLRSVAKSCGPAIYRKDATLVAFSDPKELDRVKQNFLVGKLGLEDSPALDEALAQVKASYSKRSKARVVVYYLLAKHFKKESLFLV